jgi:hypothetical protein
MRLPFFGPTFTLRQHFSETHTDGCWRWRLRFSAAAIRRRDYFFIVEAKFVTTVTASLTCCDMR